MNTLLIGPRGCGKSTVGRCLAESRDARFVDLDDEALARFAEPTVRDVWTTHGEEAWRLSEIESLAAVLAADDQVIALGGGTPMRHEARTLIDARRHVSGVRVVYLRCPVEVLRARLEASPGDRPSLTGLGIVQEIAEILRRREATYVGLADVVIDDDGSRGAAAVAREVQLAMENGRA